MDSPNYRNLEYLDIQYFPVKFEDYEQTTDRPACEKGPNDAYYHSQVNRCLASLDITAAFVPSTLAT